MKAHVRVTHTCIRKEFQSYILISYIAIAKDNFVIATVLPSYDKSFSINNEKVGSGDFISRERAIAEYSVPNMYIYGVSNNYSVPNSETVHTLCNLR